MKSDTRTEATKSLGWQAIRWVNISDILKKSRRAQKNETNNGPNDTQPSVDAVAVENNGRPTDTLAAEQNVPPGSKINVVQTPTTKKQEEKKLQGIVNQSQDVIIKVKTVFPFTLFPDTVIIDRHKMTIVLKTFFALEQSISVPIQNIKNIQAYVGPFFGSIVVTSDHFVNNTQKVRFLINGDAKNIQKIVQGAMVATQEGIDVSKIEATKLKKYLLELGEGHSTKHMQ